MSADNTWPGGFKHAMDQDEHERWNASNYPGTRELCCKCEEPTGRCDEDSMYVDELGPLCEKCYAEITEDSKMTHQQINIKIAESMGIESESHWFCEHCNIIVQQDRVTYNETHEDCEHLVTWKLGKDFFSDLNACAEFEEAMTDEQRVNYRVALVDICFRDWETGKHKHSSPTHATAPQRCEGRLTILGLWDEKEGE